MQSNEEYLDSLLKAAMGNEEEQQPEGSGSQEQPEESFDDLGDLEELLAGFDLPEEIPEDAGAENEEQPLTDFFAGEPEENREESWDGLAGEDDEMAEINELLSQSDGGSMLDDDMLALLENTSESEEPVQSARTENAVGGATDEIDIFAMDGMDDEEGGNQDASPAESSEEPPVEEKPVKKKEKSADSY